MHSNYVPCFQFLFWFIKYYVLFREDQHNTATSDCRSICERVKLTLESYEICIIAQRARTQKYFNEYFIEKFAKAKNTTIPAVYTAICRTEWNGNRRTGELAFNDSQIANCHSTANGVRKLHWEIHIQPIKLIWINKMLSANSIIAFQFWVDKLIWSADLFPFSFLLFQLFRFVLIWNASQRSLWSLWRHEIRWKLSKSSSSESIRSSFTSMVNLWRKILVQVDTFYAETQESIQITNVFVEDGIASHFSAPQ